MNDTYNKVHTQAVHYERHKKQTHVEQDKRALNSSEKVFIFKIKFYCPSQALRGESLLGDCKCSLADC